MMKKIAYSMIVMLGLPVILFAQFKIDASLSSGIAKICVVDEISGKDYPTIDEYDFGTSLKGGFETNYTFNSNLGIGIGVFYSYLKSVRHYADNQKTNRISKAISVPLNLNYTFNSSLFGLSIGSALNINLNKEDIKLFSTYQHENINPFYSIHAGCYYKLSDKFKLSFIYEADIVPFYTYSFLSTPTNHPSKEYFFRSLSLKLSYTLFGN